MVSRLQISLLVAVGVLIATPSYADVQVFGGTGCFDPPEVTSQLESILQTHSKSAQLQVRLGAHVGKTYVGISLRILSSKGRVLMQREYELLPLDCSSVPELLGIVIEEFLREIPVTQWTLPPEESKEEVVSAQKHLVKAIPYRQYTATIAIGTELNKPNPVAEILLATKFWEALPIDIGISWVLASPQDFVEGSVLYSSLSAVVGYDYQRPTWQFSARLKGGALGVWGIGLGNDRQNVLGWFDIEAGFGLVWNELIIMPTVSYSPMTYQFESLDGRNQVAMPDLKMLLGVEIPFGKPHRG